MAGAGCGGGGGGTLESASISAAKQGLQHESTMMNTRDNILVDVMPQEEFRVIDSSLTIRCSSHQ